MVDVKLKKCETAAKATNWKNATAAGVGRGMALSYRHVGLGDANARVRVST